MVKSMSVSACTESFFMVNESVKEVIGETRLFRQYRVG